jgi:MFS family permease
MFLKINDIIACRALFFIMAFYVGLWTIRIPTIKDQIQTDYLGIGFIFATFAIGSIIAMFFASKIIRNTSCKIILIYSGLFQGLLWLPTAFIKNLEIFMIIAFIFGLCFGAFEIACNLYASNLEKREKKSMMSRIHAFWSLGVLFGSLITSLFLEWNISFLNNILVYVIILLPVNLLFAFNLKEDKKSSETDKKNIFFIWPVIIFLLVIVSMANALIEGSVDAWGALYMRDYIKVDGFQIGLATLSYNIFMVIGRFSGDWFRDKLGVYNLLIILFSLTVLSLIILIFFNSIALSILGFSLLGIGTSSIIPIAYSLAGKIKGIEGGVGITIVSIAVYGTFMGAPASLGLLANAYGVNNIFIPMFIIFILLLIPIKIFKREFKL